MSTKNANKKRQKKKKDPLKSVGSKLNCPLCPRLCSDEAEFESHKRTTRHKYNYYVAQFQKYRERLSKDRHGVKVTCANKTVHFDASDGTVKSVIKSDVLQSTFEFVVTNNRKDVVYLQEACLLHPYNVFRISDEKGLAEGNVRLRIHPDCSYVVRVSFENKGIGTYGVPVQFELYPDRAAESESVHGAEKQQPKPKPFNIVRFLVVNVIDDDSPPSPKQMESPFTRETWTNIKETVEGTMPNGSPINRIQEYKLPIDHSYMFYYWPGPWENMTSEQCALFKRFTECVFGGYQSLKKNYVQFMHDLLYMEEFDGTENVQAYNMHNVTIEYVSGAACSQFKLEVPGLGEKRPSLVKGDLVYVRLRQDDGEPETKEYEAMITEVRESFVLLRGFASQFVERFHTSLPKIPRLDVRFAFNRYPLMVMHRALDLCVKDGLLDVIVFPRADQRRLPTFLNGKLKTIKFYNDCLIGNPEQKQAVLSIVQGTSRPAPYIIYGPPGTGKTVTLVEAILQVKKMLPGSYSLVVAPSNAACDNIAVRLAPHCTTAELLRLHSSTRDWDTVPAELHKYSNRSEMNYFFPTREELFKYRIVVVTLIFSGRIVERCGSNSTSRHFTHVFVDECGQAKEPETLVAIGGVVGPAGMSRLGGQVVLAGDPKQLGPVCDSHRAESVAPQTDLDEDSIVQDPLDRRIGLGVSLLERLMKTCELYKEPFDSCYITQLVYNYRSHPDILELPNRLFYDGQLQERCPETIRLDPVLKVSLNGEKRPGCAVVFHGVIGHERREGRSPSHFNMFEVEEVLKYVKKLAGPKAHVQLKQSDIGIISPYIRQVYKIKAELRKHHLTEVEVGTTETFQGREKRAIIISTVRSNRNLLDYDQKYKLGFLVNPKRLNVALTRAQSLLVVIGNPMLLAQDHQWRELVERALSLSSYYGCPYQPRDDTWVSSVLSRFHGLEIVSEA